MIDRVCRSLSLTFFTPSVASASAASPEQSRCRQEASSAESRPTPLDHPTRKGESGNAHGRVVSAKPLGPPSATAKSLRGFSDARRRRGTDITVQSHNGANKIFKL